VGSALAFRLGFNRAINNKVTDMLTQIDAGQGRTTVDFKKAFTAVTPRSQVGVGQFQVLGANLQIVLDGFGSFSVLAHNVLLQEGLGSSDKSGAVKFEPGAWYPLERWLNALERIGNEFGHYLLYQSGMTTPKNAVFPPTVTDIHSALKCIDIAYHMNHAVMGESMFNPGTGAMGEGIGHYVYANVPGKKVISIESSTPYPCDFDKGIVIAMAQRFQPGATIAHDVSKPCRKDGGSSCCYHVSWR
jgi:hypothetical protein